MTRDRLIKTALLASVGLNLFLIGVMVPHLLGGHPPHGDRMIVGGPDGTDGPGGPGGPLFAMRRMADELPEADAKILKERFSAGMEQFVDRARSFRARIDRIRDLVRADPFDATALRVELQSAADDREGMEKAQIDAIIDVLGKLSPEGRRRLAEMRPPRLIGNDRYGFGGSGRPPQGGIPLDADRAPFAAPPPPPPRDGR